MKTSRSIVRFASLITLIGSLTLLGTAAGCASSSTSQSTGEYVDDAVITTKVKSALLADDDVKSLDVSVETFDRVVHLRGIVNSEHQKASAGRVAWTVAGVKNVKNSLIVR